MKLHEGIYFCDDDEDVKHVKVHEKGFCWEKDFGLLITSRLLNGREDIFTEVENLDDLSFHIPQEFLS